jgi:hypothetical protein
MTVNSSTSTALLSAFTTLTVTGQFEAKLRAYDEHLEKQGLLEHLACARTRQDKWLRRGD